MDNLAIAFIVGLAIVIIFLIARFSTVIDDKDKALQAQYHLVRSLNENADLDEIYIRELEDKIQEMEEKREEQESFSPYKFV